MGMHDLRVFRHNEEWWVAQVHGQGAAASSHHPPPITDDHVVFTCESDDTKQSRFTGIPEDLLNELSHSAVTEILESAEVMSVRIDVRLSNDPFPPDADPSELFEDEEGLRWTVRDTWLIEESPGSVEARPAAMVACADDSALRRVIRMQDESTLQEARNTVAGHIDNALVSVVKGTFQNLD